MACLLFTSPKRILYRPRHRGGMSDQSGEAERHMKIGLHLPNSGRLAMQADHVALAQQAEVLGFSTVWVFDHLFNPVELGPDSKFPGGRYYNQAGMPYFDALTTLAVVAGATSSICLGTRVL